jgi:hypothetical protein
MLIVRYAACPLHGCIYPMLFENTGRTDFETRPSHEDMFITIVDHRVGLERCGKHWFDAKTAVSEGSVVTAAGC